MRLRYPLPQDEAARALCALAEPVGADNNRDVITRVHLDVERIH